MMSSEAALGRVAATGAKALVNLLPFDNAAMDGYALRKDDLKGAGPWTLPVAGRIAAGDSGNRILPHGSAARIFTGAPIPPGADAVVMQERVTRYGPLIRLDTAPAAGTNIRRKGEDVALGSDPVAAGLCLTAPRLAVLAGCGIPSLPVCRRLRVAMFSTGNELQEPGQPLAAGQIYNSNRVMLRALLTCPWIALTDLGILRDDPEAILCDRHACNRHRRNPCPSVHRTSQSWPARPRAAGFAQSCLCRRRSAGSRPPWPASFDPYPR